MFGEGGEDESLQTALLVIGGAVALVGLIVAAVAAAVLQIISGGVTHIPTPALVSLWEPLVAREAAAYGIPVGLDIGVITHESGGSYLASNKDSNGTTDAGLQQVNSIHWAAYGMRRNPYDPVMNVSAGLSILQSALGGRNLDDPQQLIQGLASYNGSEGTSKGLTYAGDVLGAAAGAVGPHAWAWPAAWKVRRGAFGHIGGGQYTGPATAGHGTAYVLVTAWCGQGYVANYNDAPVCGAGQWPSNAPNPPPPWATGFVAATTLTIQFSRPGQPAGPLSVVNPYATAPKALLAITPPDSRYSWAVVPVGHKHYTYVTVRAVFQVLEGTGRGARIVSVPAHESITLIEGAG